MPLKGIDLDERTFTGGLKNKYSRNRVVPIHSKIYEMVAKRYDSKFKSLIYHDNLADIIEPKYREHFNQALLDCGITTKHTPHDCRHTCNTMLDDANVNRMARYRIMGHAGKDINEKIYTHKDLTQLRAAIEKI
jgi:integrase